MNNRNKYLAIALKMVKNVADAEDIVQDAMFAAHQAGAESLYTIIVNKSIDLLRRRKRRGECELNEMPSASLFKKIEARSTARRLTHVALERFPKPVLKTFLMAIDGLPYNIIAKRMNIPRGTVAYRINHARHIISHLNT